MNSNNQISIRSASLVKGLLHLMTSDRAMGIVVSVFSGKTTSAPEQDYWCDMT